MHNRFSKVSMLEVEIERPTTELVAVGSALIEADAAPVVDWLDVPLPQLVRHIVTVCHNGLRAAMPRLKALAQEVAETHGWAYPHLLEVASILRRIDAEMHPHMQKEEDVLFPLFVSLEQGPMLQAATVGVAIGLLTSEHENTSHNLALLRDLTDGYYLPEGASASFCALYTDLAQLEAQTRSNARLEEKILFRRALAFIAKMQRSGSSLVGVAAQAS